MSFSIRIRNKICKKLASYNFDFLFFLAAATLPFENLIFAPSSGWATITPLLLFLYTILSLYFLKPFLKLLRPIFYFFLFFCILGSITAIFFHGRLDDYLSAYTPIILGLSCLASLLIFYTKNKQHLKTKLNLLVTILILSYLLAMFIGFIEFITIKYNLNSVADFFAQIFKRNYLARNRIQFFFTEPSFIGMHLFGILLPLFWITRRYELIIIILMFSFEAIFFGSGIRIILDFLIIGTLVSFYYLKKTKNKLLIPVFLTSLLIIVTSITVINGRFQKIFFGFLKQPTEVTNFCENNTNKNSKECLDLVRQSGVNSDGSFASRFFRIQSSLLGYTKSPLGLFTGFGLGNAIHPARLGHADARKTYKSTYLKEVNDLIDPSYHDDSISYCLYTRIVSEFGIFALVIALFYLIHLAKNSKLDYRFFFLLILLYLYLQFESLSFYTIWLYIAIMLLSRRTDTNFNVNVMSQIPRPHISSNTNTSIDTDTSVNIKTKTKIKH